MQNKSCRPQISLRYLLAFAVGIALLCGLRQYFLATLISYYAALYYAVVLSGMAAAACHRRQTCKLIRPFRRDEQTIGILFMVALCNLTIYFIFHVTILMVTYDIVSLGHFFFDPIFAGLSIYGIEQAILIAIHVALFLVYWGNCLTTGEVQAAEVRDTAALSFLLTASHFASPWAVDAVAAFGRVVFAR